jgi:OmpA-OmpF porin, OOP family
MTKHIIIRMKKATLIAGLTMVVLGANAQFAYNYLKAGDEYFRKGDYFSAAQYYEKALTSKGGSKTDKVDPYKIESLSTNKKATAVSNHDEVVYKTAESYRLINNYIKAEPYYMEASQKPAQFPLALYWYAKSLRYNSKFPEAESAFSQFLQEYAAGDEKVDDAKKEIANLQFIQKELKKDTSLFKVTKISADAFTNGADYAPAMMGGNTLVFTSTRADDLGGKKQHINKLYQSAATTATTSATLLDVPQAPDVHQGVASFSPDGSMMYLTKWSTNEGKKTASVYFSKKTSGKWTEPALLKGDVNMEGYSSQQPFVAPDGTHLIYSSNKPGGLGKFDLWMTTVDADGNAGASVNLGNTINTREDEQAPYYFGTANSLVYSSNGMVGMGGFDFYQAKGDLNSWATPVNLGYPINSVKDDIYLVSAANKYMLDNIYFSSDRYSQCCLEMFALSKTRLMKQISGLVVDCKTGEAIPNATVTIIDTINSVTVATKTTSTQGAYDLTLEEFQPLKVTAQAEGYTGTSSIQMNVPTNEETVKLGNPSICLTKPEIVKPFEENVPVVLHNIFFEFDKYKLDPRSYPALDDLVTSLKGNPTMVIEVSAHTDALGDDAYNMQLSELRAKSVVEYLLSKGIEASRIETKGYGETMPVAPNKKPNGKDNPEGRAKNRRVEFKVLHY